MRMKILSREIEKVIKAKKDLGEFDHLYRKYFPRINNFVFHRVQDDAVRNEIVSNVFFKAMKNLTKFRFFTSRRSSFSAWLYRIALSEMNQYFRERKREQKIQQKLNWNQVQGEDFEIDYSNLKMKLTELSSDEQNLISLRFFEKMSYKEIGEILKKKEGTVKVRMHRLLKKIRSQLEKEMK